MGKTGRHKSWAWDYFIPSININPKNGNPTTAACRFCKTSFVTNATRMENHLLLDKVCPPLLNLFLVQKLAAGR